MPRRPPGARFRARRPCPEIVVAAPSPTAIDLIAARRYGLVARNRLGLLDAEIARFTLPQNRTIEQARTEILQFVPSALVDPNHIYRTNELACGRGGCAAFGMIGWKEAPHACPVDITIDMVDTGVNTGHEALAGTALQRVSVVDPKRRPSSRTHGTAIAVLLAGRAGSRTPGLLSGARLVAVDAFHSNARGQDEADVFDIARALDLIAASKARVVNLSFAGPANLVLERVVRALVERDVVLVTAAGNSGPRADPLYPAAYPDVVAVTAVDSRLRAYRQAVAGEHIDFAAPGVRSRSGTSYAAPFVSAALPPPARPIHRHRAGRSWTDLPSGPQTSVAAAATRPSAGSSCRRPRSAPCHRRISCRQSKRSHKNSMRHGIGGASPAFALPKFPGWELFQPGKELTMSIEDTKPGGLSRRAMLTRLGLAAATAYMAPAMLKLDEAHASSGRSGGSR